MHAGSRLDRIALLERSAIIHLVAGNHPNVRLDHFLRGARAPVRDGDLLGVAQIDNVVDMPEFVDVGRVDRETVGVDLGGRRVLPSGSDQAASAAN